MLYTVTVTITITTTIALYSILLLYEICTNMILLLYYNILYYISSGDTCRNSSQESITCHIFSRTGIHVPRRVYFYTTGLLVLPRIYCFYDG